MDTLLADARPSVHGMHELSPMGRVDDVNFSNSVTEHGPNTQETSTIQELPPMDGGIKAWSFIASAFIMELLLWGFSFSYGIFQDYYTSHPPFNSQSLVAIAAVGTVSLGCTYGEALILSLFLARYPELVKPCMWCGILLSFAGLLVSSFANKVWQLILLQGVVSGIGAGLAYFPILHLLPQWFARRKGFAVGIIFAGTGLGGVAVPLLLHALLDSVGFRWTLRIWAILLLVFSCAAVLGIQPRTPVPRFTGRQGRPRFIPPQMHFLKSAIFWTNSVTIMLQGLSFFPVSLYLAMYTTTIATPLTATIALSVFNCAATIGMVLIGHLCDRVPYVWVMLVAALGSAVATFLLWGFADSLTLVFLYAIIFGALSGGFPSMGPVVAADSTADKPEHAGIVWGAQLFLKGVAVVLGPTICASLYSGNSSTTLSASGKVAYGYHGFGGVEIFVGVCAIGATIGSVIVAWMRVKVRS